MTILEKSGVTLSLSKYHFAYLFIKALGYYVSRLDLTTLEEKSVVVKRFAYLKNLAELENGFEFFSYYRKFVDYYIYIAEPLEELKARLLRKVLVKECKRKTYIENVFADNGIFPLSEAYKDIWDVLKERIESPLILIFLDFEKDFVLYVNGFYERGLDVALY